MCEELYYDENDGIYHPSAGGYCGPNFIFQFINENLDLVHEIIGYLKTTYNYASFLSFLINILHLFILLQKELRPNLVFIIMAGICICDILQSLANMSQLFMLWNIVYKIEICFTDIGHKYSHLIVNLAAKTVQIMSRRCSSFLALYIAIIRTLSVVFPMSNTVAKITSSKSGILVMFLVSACCGIWSSIYFRRTKIEKILYCSIGVPKPSYIPYTFQRTQSWEYTFFFIDGSLAIFVSISYVIIGIILVVAIRQAKQRTRSLKNETKSSNTSALVIFMMVTVFISESIYGLLYFSMFRVFQFNDDAIYIDQLNVVVWTVLILNSTTHSVMCLFMSSQYRDTVKRLLRMDKKDNKSLVSVVRPVSGQTESSKVSDTSKRTFGMVSR